MGTWKYCKRECARGVIDSVSEFEIGEPSSNSNLVLYTHLHVNDPGKCINSHLRPNSELISKTSIRKKKLLFPTEKKKLQYKISS